MGYAVIDGAALAWGHPSWRPEDTVREIVEVSRLSSLEHSRANLWRYPPGAAGRRHVQLVQEEVFVVLEGRLTLLLGEPPEQYELGPRSIAVVQAHTPIKVMNQTESEAVFFVYGAPSDPSAEIVEDVPAHVKRRIGPEDIPA